MDEQAELKEAARILVLVVDDHPIMRVGIAAIIQATPDMTTVAQAGSGEEAVELFEKHLPDITLMDLRLPGMSGVDAIRTVMARHRNAKFVVLTTYEGDEDIHQAVEAGAQLHHQGNAARCAYQRLAPGSCGREVSSSACFARPFLAHPQLRTQRARARSTRLIALGKSNKEIATGLGITESTVKRHVSVILMRLNVTDRTQAVVTALQRGLVHL